MEYLINVTNTRSCIIAIEAKDSAHALERARQEFNAKRLDPVLNEELTLELEN